MWSYFQNILHFIWSRGAIFHETNECFKFGEAKPVSRMVKPTAWGSASLQRLPHWALTRSDWATWCPAAVCVP